MDTPNSGGLSNITTLHQGQRITAEFTVEKDMDWSEARELIRSNAPSSFRVQSIGLVESYGAGSSVEPGGSGS